MCTQWFAQTVLRFSWTAKVWDMSTKRHLLHTRGSCCDAVNAVNSVSGRLWGCGGTTSLLLPAIEGAQKHVRLPTLLTSAEEHGHVRVSLLIMMTTPHLLAGLDVHDDSMMSSDDDSLHDVMMVCFSGLLGIASMLYSARTSMAS